MSKSKSLVLALVFISLNCESVVEVKLPDIERKLVLNSFLNSDSTLVASLHASETILDDSQFEVIPDANIRLLNEEGTVVTELHYDSLGLYSSDFMPEEGVNYRIEGVRNGFSSISAETRIPVNLLDITNLQARALEEDLNDSTFTQQILHEIAFNIKDSGEEEHFYELELIEEGVVKFTFEGEYYEEAFKNKLYLSTEDPVFDEFNSDGTSLLFNDALFNGISVQIEVEAYLSTSFCRFYCEDYEVILNVKTVTEEYFRYKRSLALQLNLDGNPFAEPVSVFNNIRNGFGIFAGYRNNTYPIELD